MSAGDRVKVGVLGATGYSGIEAVRILSGHPFVELSVLTSENYAGREIADVYRHLRGIDLPPLEELRPDLSKGRSDVFLSCLPEKAGTTAIADLVASGAGCRTLIHFFSPLLEAAFSDVPVTHGQFSSELSRMFPRA